MPKKKAPAAPVALRTADFIRFTSCATYAFERITQVDGPQSQALLGDVGALQRTGKAILGALRSGGLIIMPPAPLPDPERAAGPALVGRGAKGRGSL